MAGSNLVERSRQRYSRDGGTTTFAMLADGAVHRHRSTGDS